MFGLLIDAGCQVFGVDPSAVSRQATSSHYRAQMVASLRELPDSPEVVVSCVPGPEEVWSISKQVAERMEPVSFFINMSTVGPKATYELEDFFSRNLPKTAYIECPVSGGVLRAAAKEAALLPGSRNQDAVREVLPLLQVLSNTVLPMQDAIAASSMKLINNIAAMNIAMGTLEAIEFGSKLGLGLESLFTTLQAGTASSYILGSALSRAILQENYDTGFALRLALKDLHLVLDHPQACEIELGHTRLTASALEHAALNGFGDLVFAMGSSFVAKRKSNI